MHASLVPHPAAPAGALRSIEVDVARLAPAELSLRYRLTGDIGSLRLPEPASPARTDELWRHTCLEAFLSGSKAPAYCEFNLSPSSQWAAYSFDDYRAGMAVLDIAAPTIRTGAGDDWLTLRALLDLTSVEGLDPQAGWQIGLAAVIEAKDGGLSYWALRHPGERPDFHHRHCFQLELPPAKQR
jgi:hypothetical protein